MTDAVSAHGHESEVKNATHFATLTFCLMVALRANRQVNAQGTVSLLDGKLKLDTDRHIRFGEEGNGIDTIDR